MTKTIDADLLRSTACAPSEPRRCWDAAYGLWPLSPWLLRPEFLESACSWPVSANCPGMRKRMLDMREGRTLARGKGCCHVLFAVVNLDLARQAPHMRESFALPLAWKAGSEDAPDLPSNLAAMARAIGGRTKGAEGWGLRWNFEGAGDWRFALDLECSSGWASLSAALILGVEGGTPEPGVWASAAWDPERGIQAVECLPAKLESVRALGGSKLFVPRENLESAREASREEARRTKRPEIEIRALHSAELDPRKALAPYLAELDAPPDTASPLEDRCAYYMRQDARDRESAYQYYIQNLLDDLAEKCRRRGIEGLAPGEWERLENLVSFASLQTGALLMIAALHLRRMLLFYTEESRKDLGWFETLAARRNIEIEKVLLDIQDEGSNDGLIREGVRDFANRCGPDRTAVDTTPGPKFFSVIAAWAVDPGRTPCLYLGHAWDRSRRRVPGSERIRRLIHGPDGNG